MDPKSPRNDLKHWANKLSQRRLATILKQELRMKTGKAAWHKNKPNCVVIGPEEVERLKVLGKRFGLDEDGAPESTSATEAGGEPPAAPPLPIDWDDTGQVDEFLDGHG